MKTAMQTINPPKLLENLTRLEARAYKMNDVYQIDLIFHFTTLFYNEENKWFKATNRDGTHNYDVCTKLFEMNLICKKVVPAYKDGYFVGNKIYFKYNKDLNYE